MDTKPSDPGMAGLRKLNHTRQLQQKKEDEYLQAMPALMSPLSAAIPQLSFILDGQSTQGSKIPPVFCSVVTPRQVDSQSSFLLREELNNIRN